MVNVGKNGKSGNILTKHLGNYVFSQPTGTMDSQAQVTCSVGESKLESGAARGTKKQYPHVSLMI